jgi:hypothetical protein
VTAACALVLRLWPFEVDEASVIAEEYAPRSSAREVLDPVNALA